MGSAGTHHDAGLPEISGAFGVRGTMIIDNSIIEANGAFRITETSYDVNYASFQVTHRAIMSSMDQVLLLCPRQLTFLLFCILANNRNF